MADFEADIIRRIEAAYESTSNELGWRFLYSPRSVLADAKVVFLGLNPGGRSNSEGHAEFAMETGSAYVCEAWAGRNPGESPLQVQVRTLFESIGVRPDKVLAGNLVPFRSSDWKSLQDRRLSLKLGTEIWREVLDHLSPDLIIGMGKQLLPILADFAGQPLESSHDINWNGLRISWTTNHAGQRFVHLPHLSQYKIMRREKSLPALRMAFGDTWQGP